MRLICFLALFLLFAACKTTHPDTQSTAQVQQHDSLVQYTQERRTQTLTLDQWQEVEWEMDTGSITPPTDTLSPFPALATFTEVKQGKAHKVVMRAPHLSLKIKRVTQQQAQGQQQISSNTKSYTSTIFNSRNKRLPNSFGGNSFGWYLQ